MVGGEMEELGWRHRFGIRLLILQREREGSDNG